MANRQVGDYLNDFYVSSFQKVGTFRINRNGNKQGGNVASYFCTSDGRVLHVVAGPVDAQMLLREARWVVETCKMAQMKNQTTLYRLRQHFRVEHVERLRDEHHVALPYRYLPKLFVNGKGEGVELGKQVLKDRRYGSRHLSNQGKVHKILACYPLPKVGQIYAAVFEDVLKEKISTRPVETKK